MFWTFVDGDQIRQGRIRIEGAAGHHLARVLRLRPGERGVAVHAAREYSVEVIEAGGDRLELGILAERPVSGEPAVEVIVLQALLPNPDFDAVVEGGTAVGVSGFMAVSSARSISRPAQGRLPRWMSIARSAAEQSHRGTIPSIAGPLSLKDALTHLSGRTLLILDPAAQAPILEAAAGAAKPAIAVGPEGGWTDEELSLMKQAGGIPSNLGPRILRARLAALVATAILVQHR